APADGPARGGVSVTAPPPPCLGRSVGRRKLHRVAGFALSQSDVLHADLSDRGLDPRATADVERGTPASGVDQSPVLVEADELVQVGVVCYEVVDRPFVLGLA